MLKRWLFILGSVLLVLSLLGISDAEAKQPFSNNDLKGDFGFSFDGELLAGPFIGLIGAVGQFNSDGAGNIPTAVRTLNLVGVFVLQQTAVGTYQVNPDGTGTAQFTVTTVSPAGFPVSTETFAFVITGKRKEISLVSTTAGIVAVGGAKRQ